MLSNKQIVQKRSASTSNLSSIEKFQSTENYRKKRTVKVKSDCNLFINNFEMFENALSKLEIDRDNEEVLEKLHKIEKVIKEKILLINENKNKKHKNVEFSKELTSSMGNLFSEALAFEENVKTDSSFAEFLKRVNCPFCSEPKADKIKLIQHLDEGCKPRINKMFDEKCPLPFSAFQILPNNTFKCNICPNAFMSGLKNYFEHLQTKFHISAHAKAVKIKNYAEFLFCASCKVQVANNYTQIHFHLNHRVHKTKSNSAPNISYFMKKGIHCLYLRSKKFKCFDCPLNFYKTPGDFMKHFEDRNHLKCTKKNAPHFMEQKLFCEICSKEVYITEIFKHFMLNDHKDKENEIMEENYEMCFFCGFVCDNLTDLSLHMESKCGVIDSIKQQNPKSKKTAKNDLKDKTMDERNTDGGYIVVKDYKDIPTLFSYFEQFGEITSLESFDGKHTAIKFKKKSTAACILLVKDKLNINGVELKLATDDQLFKSKEKTVVSEEKRQILREDEISHSSCDSCESEEDSDCNEDIDSNYNEMLQKEELQTLFQKVTSYLINISRKSDSAAEIKNILHCSEICTGEACSLVGFAFCELTFPFESINLYCKMRNDHPNIFSAGSISVNDADLNTLIFLEKLSKKMCESELWQNVIISAKSFPHIKCKHKETQKICTITCSKSAMLLTEMLRDCLKENHMVRSFCALSRFWLTVQKLKIRKFEYVVMSLFIFFLISKKVVNLSLEIYYTEEDFLLKNQIQDEFGLKQNSSRKERKETFNLQELFYEFLEFLSTFDFDKFAIYLPLCYPVPKKFILKKLKVVTESAHDKVSKSSMYITESRSLLNLAFFVTEEHVKSLLKVVNSAIKNHRT